MLTRKMERIATVGVLAMVITLRTYESDCNGFCETLAVMLEPVLCLVAHASGPMLLVVLFWSS